MTKIIKITEYDRHYLLGGFGYSLDWGKKLLKANTDLLDGRTGTLLDAGCGDGFWSNILSEYYTVTAEDTSLGGIMMGSAKDKEKLVTWVHGDSRESLEPHDVVFARGPSFLNCERDAKFIRSLELLLARTKSLFVFIHSTRAPFDVSDGGNYYHDPKEIEKCFSKYGKTTVIYKDGYIWATIKK